MGVVRGGRPVRAGEGGRPARVAGGELETCFRRTLSTKRDELTTYHITMHRLSKIGTAVLCIVLARRNDAIRIFRLLVVPESLLQAVLLGTAGLLLCILNPNNLVHSSLVAHAEDKK